MMWFSKSFWQQIRASISLRIFLIVTMLVLVPAVFLFLGSLALFEGAVREALNMELRTALDGAERDITSFLADLVAISGVIANDPMVFKAVSEETDLIGQVRIIDKAVDGLLTPLPGNDAIKYTLITKAGLFSSWSRNFNDYSFISDLPLVKAASERSGHVVWQGFTPSLVMEERSYSLVASLARSFPLESIGKIDAGSLGVLILSAESEAFKHYLADKRPGSSYTTLLLSESGSVYVEATDRAVPETVPRRIATEIGSNIGKDTDIHMHIGDYLVAERKLSGLPQEFLNQGWSVAVLYSYGNVERRFVDIRSAFLLAFTVMLVLALIVVFFVSRRVVGPIVSLSRIMEKWSPDLGLVNISGKEGAGGRETDHLDIVRPDEIGALNRSFRRMQENILELINGIQREHAVRDLYRYRALRSQLNPHFLFNSLNSIRWLAIIRREDNIVSAVDDLSNILAYSIGKNGDISTLRSELDSVKHYLAIQNLRYGGRFLLETRIPEELLEYEIPRFMLQPLVENCILHAYQGVAGEGLIEIEAESVREDIFISVADRDTGLDPAALERALDDDRNRDRDAGIGLRNIRDMLALSYGENGRRADLSIMAREGGGAVVRILLPKGLNCHSETEET